jgi:hypothetical protein
VSRSEPTPPSPGQFATSNSEGSWIPFGGNSAQLHPAPGDLRQRIKGNTETSLRTPQCFQWRWTHRVHIDRCAAASSWLTVQWELGPEHWQQLAMCRRCEAPPVAAGRRGDEASRLIRDWSSAPQAQRPGLCRDPAGESHSAGSLQPCCRAWRGRRGPIIHGMLGPDASGVRYGLGPLVRCS